MVLVVVGALLLRSHAAPRAVIPRMEQDPTAADVGAGPDVSEAAAQLLGLGGGGETPAWAAEAAAKLLGEETERQDVYKDLFAAPAGADGEQNFDAFSRHEAERAALVGLIPSSDLLQRDEERGYPTPALEQGAEMLFVDELSCIGCKYCTTIARATFRMEDGPEDFGTARAVEQGGDPEDVVEEAIDVCPADCIHRCTRGELEVLETYRGLYFGDLMAKWSGRRLVAGGEGGGASAAPHWRDPLVHTSWMKGAKYVRTERAKLSDPLLHHSGDATEFSIIGTHKVNEDKE